MLAVLLLLSALLLLRLVGKPFLFKAVPASPYANLETKWRSSSIVYEIFKPAINPYNRLVDFFRPSHLRAVGCYRYPAAFSGAIFNWLTGLCQ